MENLKITSTFDMSYIKMDMVYNEKLYLLLTLMSYIDRN